MFWKRDSISRHEWLTTELIRWVVESSLIFLTVSSSSRDRIHSPYRKKEQVRRRNWIGNKLQRNCINTTLLVMWESRLDRTTQHGYSCCKIYCQKNSRHFACKETTKYRMWVSPHFVEEETSQETSHVLSEKSTRDATVISSCWLDFQV